MNRLTRSDRAKILHSLVEGNSLRATARMHDVSLNTVMKLLVDVGPVASAMQDRLLRDLPCKRLQCDEVWSFVGAKDKTIERNARHGLATAGDGSVWTWTAICADTKVIPSFLVGSRDAEVANVFMGDLAGRLHNRVQLTTDGHGAYLVAVPDAFGPDIDYAMLIKHYGPSPGNEHPESRYSPGDCTGTEKRRITGGPDEKHVSTSYVERANLSIRMGNRRFTRLTNAFSKKIENHVHSLSLYFWWYNFGRIHRTLRVTPAMEAKVTERVWNLEELVELLEIEEAARAADAPVKPGRKPGQRNRPKDSN